MASIPTPTYFSQLPATQPTDRTAKAMERWQLIVEELENPDVELDLETFAPLLATFQQLQRCGVQFDRGLVALMAILKRQAFSKEASND